MAKFIFIKLSQKNAPSLSSSYILFLNISLLLSLLIQSSVRSRYRFLFNSLCLLSQIIALLTLLVKSLSPPHLISSFSFSLFLLLGIYLSFFSHSLSPPPSLSPSRFLSNSLRLLSQIST